MEVQVFLNFSCVGGKAPGKKISDNGNLQNSMDLDFLEQIFLKLSGVNNNILGYRDK